MDLDQEACRRAAAARDPRFDGKFFTAVRTTRIFCRPICPAPTPRAENCRFFRTAAEAVENGYRPCLRCRPETSPGAAAWNGTRTTVERALRLIEDGALEGRGVESFAADLGLGARQLRRLFAAHVGASPIAIEQTRRLLLAKKLIDETSAPLAEIALAAGFGGARRLQEAIRAVYGRSPRELRVGAAKTSTAGATAARLGFRPPLEWASLLGFLAARALPDVEQVIDGGWRRTFRIDGASGSVSLRLDGAGGARFELQPGAVRAFGEITRRVRRLFDLDADPAAVDACLAADPVLRPLVARRPGLRLPGSWDGFETAVRAILGQRISVRAARALAGRLVARFGSTLPEGRLFPEPAALTEAPLETIGLPTRRAEAIRALSREVAAGRLLVSPRVDPATLRERLLALPGVGPWTAEYVAMRAGGDPDAFPSGDLGLLRSYARRSGAAGVGGRELERIAEAWRPWRAYAAMHLWMAENDR